MGKLDKGVLKERLADEAPVRGAEARRSLWVTLLLALGAVGYFVWLAVR